MITAMDIQLRSRIKGLMGTSFHYEGKHLLVHELLTEQEILVLLSLDKKRGIQNNQYGEPSRRTPELMSVSLKTDEQGKYDPLIGFLLANH
jgi:hypothetical protein